VQLPQVHRYSFAGGSVEAFAGFEAVARLSIEVGSEGWRYHERGGGRQEWDRGWRKFHCYRYRLPRAGYL
jgi:hypothetical protein